MLWMYNALDSNYIGCASVCLSNRRSHMTDFRVTTALSANARRFSTGRCIRARSDQKQEPANAMDHTMLTLRYARDKTRHTLRQAQQQSPSNLVDESTPAGDLPTKEGVSGILASGRRRRLAPARSAELLSLCSGC